MLNIKDNSIKAIREAIAGNSNLRLNESAIKVFSPSSDEYKKLECAAELLSTLTEKLFNVETTYFDAGQDWKWSTIIAYGKNGSFQLLNPRDQEAIVTATSAEKIGKIVDDLIKKDGHLF